MEVTLSQNLLAIEWWNMDAEECTICFIELDGNIKPAYLACGHSGFCVDCAEKLKQCPLCRTALAPQPAPLLLHFMRLTGSQYDVTCHPDQTLREIGKPWACGCDFKMIFAGKRLDLDVPIGTLGLANGATVHFQLNIRAD